MHAKCGASSHGFGRKSARPAHAGVVVLLPGLLGLEISWYSRPIRSPRTTLAFDSTPLRHEVSSLGLGPTSAPPGWRHEANLAMSCAPGVFSATELSRDSLGITHPKTWTKRHTMRLGHRHFLMGTCRRRHTLAMLFFSCGCGHRRGAAGRALTRPGHRRGPDVCVVGARSHDGVREGRLHWRRSADAGGLRGVARSLGTRAARSSLCRAGGRPVGRPCTRAGRSGRLPACRAGGGRAGGWAGRSAWRVGGWSGGRAVGLASGRAGGSEGATLGH